MGTTSSRPLEGKESLYDLLNVSSDADFAALKKAYRQRALELHPDRNYNNEEEATALFAKVQAAYDILTDPQERQWYDVHRKNKRYDEYEGGVTTAADVRAATSEVLAKSAAGLDFDLISSYFETLKHEEQEAAFEQGIEMSKSIVYAAGFGSRTDSWNKVKPFYDEWSSFSTLKSYNWEDIYPLHSAQDRRTRRKFEQANKKVRDAAKREFNAAVTQAVALLRQRDPRRPTESTSANRAKQEEAIAKEQQKRAERSKFMRDNFKEQEWQKPPEIAATESDAAVPPELSSECIICEITFDTDFDLQDHLKTTKHKKAAAALKAQMLQEDELLGGLSLEDNPEIVEQPAEQALKKPGKAKLKAKKKKQGQHILTCGTCGLELPGPELIAHKQQTRHP